MFLLLTKPAMIVCVLLSSRWFLNCHLKEKDLWTEAFDYGPFDGALGYLDLKLDG
jgi:hypothetical protein